MLMGVIDAMKHDIIEETTTNSEKQTITDDSQMDDTTDSSDKTTRDQLIPRQLEIQDQDQGTTSQDETATPSLPIHDQHTQQLEERVRELEVKLATLSLLLSPRKRERRLSQNILGTSPSTTPPTVDESPFHPMLESPAPPARVALSEHKRNLSYQILHDGNLTPASDIFTPRMDDEKDLKSGTNTNAPKSLSKEEFVTALKMSTPSLKEEEGRPTPKHLDLDTPMNGVKTDIKNKWLDYLNSFQESNYDVDLQMEEFVKIPGAVESLLGFGFWICVDSFLYVLTILPIRFIWSILLLLRYGIIRSIKHEVPVGPFRFHRRSVIKRGLNYIHGVLELTKSVINRHSYQLIQVAIIYTIYRFVLTPISIGKLYHWIRGQAMIKLYVIIAMLEVFDRLLCSLGQDCLESLYWNTTRRPRSSRLFVSVAVVLVYTTIHSFLLFVHVATLNVAMNSDDQALLSLLIGGNFAEIKSTVFKKYNKATLFKIVASDICERFKLALFLTLVLLLNLSQGMDSTMVMNYFHMCGIVWAAEWLSDWIKHSFITKFNYISSGIYPEYGLLLAGDFNGIGHEGVNMDHSHAVVKRLGFAQMPLVCVLFRYLQEAYKYATYRNSPSNLIIGLVLISVWFVLLLCKQVLGSVLRRISHQKLKAAPEFCSNNAKVAKRKAA
ncbi:MAG: hypothetical protein SGBAC_006668 [Bacillariaceae sp.]